MEFKEKIERSEQIVAVFWKYDVFNVSKLPIVKKLKFKKLIGQKETAKLRTMSLPARVRMAFEELGPTFVKFGQMLSVRPDFVSPNFIEEFSKLQDGASAFEFSEVKRLFKEQTGKEISKVFSSFGRIPVAAASLSQVHRAVLPSKKIVAVKIRRPGIKPIIQSDIAILRSLTKMLDLVPMIGEVYQTQEIIEQFAQSIDRELDFYSEGRNAELFARNFSSWENVAIPKIYWPATAEGVLTMDYINGVKLSRVIKDKKTKYDKKYLADLGANAVLKQIFEDGFFHADLHPGNIMVQGRKELVFLDFGMMGRVDDATMDAFAKIMLAVIEKNYVSLFSGLDDLDLLSDHIDRNKFQRDVTEFINDYYNHSLGDLNVKEILGRLFQLMAKHKIKLPANLALLLRALITIEGVGMELDPDFSVMELIEPYAKKLALRKYSLPNIAKSGKNLTSGIVDFVSALPQELYHWKTLLRQNRFSISLKHEKMEEFIAEIDRASNDVSFSIIIAAIIIGSSTIIQLDKPPFLFGYSALGVVGYVIAVALGIGLIANIIRKGKI